MISIVTIYNKEHESYLDDLKQTLPNFGEWLAIKTIPTNNPEKYGISFIEEKDSHKYFEYYYDSNDYFGYKEARNAVKEYFKYDWIMTLDSDERLLINQHEGLKGLIQELKNKQNIDGIFCHIVSFVNNAHGQRLENVHSTRIYRKHKDIKYISKVHETLDITIKQRGGEYMLSDLIIHHIGYSDSKKLQDKLYHRIRGMVSQPNITLKYDDYFELLCRDTYTYYSNILKNKMENNNVK